MEHPRLRLLITVAICLVFFVPSAWAGKKEIKLHIASWNVPKDPNTKVLKTIAADLEAASGGKIKSEISFKALGKPQDYYDAAANGICDIAYVGLPYTPGRFPFSDMLGLPILFPDNKIATKAHYELWQRGYLDKQFRDVKVICVGSTGPYNFMWGKDSIKKLDGFKGKKIRCPGGPWTRMTEALGGVPVSVSAAESYMAIERGTIDGILQSWPAVPVFKLHEVCKHVTQLNLSCFGFAIVMNEYAYDSLPQAAKEMLTMNAEKYSVLMGEAHHNFNLVGMKMMASTGNEVDTLSAEDAAALKQQLKPVFNEWIKSMGKKRLPGEKALDELYSILQDLGVKEPFVK